MTRKTAAEACERADRAIERIENHEEICAQRYELIAAGQTTQQRSLDAQQKTLDEFKGEVRASLSENRADTKWMMRWIIATLLTALSCAIGVIVVLATHGK